MAAATIRSATVELWDFQLSGPTGGSGVTGVDVIVVVLEDGEGRTGTGFSYVLGGGGAIVRDAAQSLLDRFVAGEAARHPAALWRILAASLNRLGRGPAYLAITGIDVAAWDLYARTLDVPLGVALGGEGRAVPVYGSGGFGPAQDPDDAAARAMDYADRGYSAVKLRLGGNHADIARMAAVANALPDGVDLMVDANEKCDLARARWLANECAAFNVLWLEEPLPANDTAGYAALARASVVPIALGEHLQGAVEFAPHIEAATAPVLQPDLAMMGGITECLHLAQIAAFHNAVIAPHFLPNLFVHVAAAAPAVRWLEHFPLLEPLFDGLPDIVDGRLAMPDTPGHGMRFRDGAREEFLVR